ncbi:hypothetical protein ACWEKT_08000 [Nocardia takedensis]|uniref:hypothetical protein n=1 Tax=Nocardia takedensis TaxID=259390 RepID=UPI0002D92482|nr:hypothetical protein [Nocardia takedensis]
MKPQVARSGGARFVGPTDLAATISALRPVESRFFELVERLAEVEEDAEDERFETDVPRDPAFIDPAVPA